MSLRINPNSVEHWKSFNKCCFLSLPPVGTLKKNQISIFSDIKMKTHLSDSKLNHMVKGFQISL